MLKTNPKRMFSKHKVMQVSIRKEKSLIIRFYSKTRSEEERVGGSRGKLFAFWQANRTKFSYYFAL